MLRRDMLGEYLRDYLDVAVIQDYCPNGLQVQGKSDIKRIITGVTASQSLIDAAIQAKADAILVHHGFFWKGESPEVVGMKYRRLKLLLTHDINLFAYHLPLDVHPEIGNNAMLAKQLGIKVLEQVDADGIKGLVWCGELEHKMALSDFTLHVEKQLQRVPLLIGDKKTLVRKIAWCTGGAQRYIDTAHQLGADVFISGEASEQTTHFARENNIAFLGCGHHATERYGIIALGEHIKERYSLEVNFIDIDNPV